MIPKIIKKTADHHLSMIFSSLIFALTFQPREDTLVKKNLAGNDASGARWRGHLGSNEISTSTLLWKADNDISHAPEDGRLVASFLRQSVYKSSLPLLIGNIVSLERCNSLSTAHHWIWKLLLYFHNCKLKLFISSRHQFLIKESWKRF